MGGAERVAAMLAEAQAEAGHDVIATSLTRQPELPGRRVGVETRPLRHRNPIWIEDGPRWPAPVRLANKIATVFNPVTVSDLARLIDDVRPDVIHSHSMVELPPAMWTAAKARGVALVHTLHDYDLLCIRAAMFKDGRRCRPRHLACRLLSAPKQARHSAIDAVVAVSRTVMERHLENGLFEGLPQDRRRIIWNPVAAAAQAGERNRAPRSPHRFGFLGRLVAQKGLGVLIEACRLLPQNGWSLQIAGAGPEEAVFRAAAAGLPIDFVGFVDANDFLRDVDTLVVAPIWDEPFGLTTLEAYAAGVRVIGADVGVIAELVERVDPGWSVPAVEPAALAAAMVRAMAATDAMDMARIRTLLDDLQPAVVAERYIQLYRLVTQS